MQTPQKAYCNYINEKQLTSISDQSPSNKNINDSNPTIKSKCKSGERTNFTLFINDILNQDPFGKGLDHQKKGIQKQASDTQPSSHISSKTVSAVNGTAIFSQKLAISSGEGSCNDNNSQEAQTVYPQEKSILSGSHNKCALQNKKIVETIEFM